MRYQGTLRKMKSQLKESVQYWLNLDKEPIAALNPAVGSDIQIDWTGNIFCVNCGKKTPKSYGQGFCYKCLMESPQAAPCIMRPELCEGHEGKGRDVQWEQDHHVQPHVVYLAQTSGVKVGVTRSTQIPTRWIDQGAWRTVVLANLPYRYLSGVMEVELKQFISDRTDWRKMLIDQRDESDLAEVRDTMIEFLPPHLTEYVDRESVLQELTYPVLAYPEKVGTIKLAETKTLRGKLTGIRGQYLYLDGDKVINLRKYSGYEVAVQL